MKKQLVIIAIITLFVCVGLSGCSNKGIGLTNSLQSDRDKLVGTWTTTEESPEYFKLVFFFNGTLTVTARTNSSGTYEIKDGKLTLGNVTGQIYDYSFSSDGKELTLQQIDSDFVITLTKQ
ncbi:MAG: hypothetical protein NT038_08770 [Euryarchaeota archaeon]|nr:hypothetical protein [Euryarchaeota archaeon]